MDKINIFDIWSLTNCVIVFLSLIIFCFLDYYFYKSLLKDKIRLAIHSLFVISYFLLWLCNPEKFINLFLSLMWVVCLIIGIKGYFISKKSKQLMEEIEVIKADIRRIQLERGLTEEQIETDNKLMMGMIDGSVGNFSWKFVKHD